MKKINFKYRLLFVGMVGLLFAACEEGDKVVDDIVASEARGAVLRTINVISDEIPIGQGDANFAVELEVQDQENGNLVQAVEAWVSFTDTTVEEGETDFSTEEFLAETLDASTFSTGEFGLPRFSYSITLSELLAILPISDATVNGSDEFNIRFELVLIDGRRFSVADNNGNITGTFFNSPFLYSALVTCPPKPPTPGIWTINMTDSFGDGWQTDDDNGGSGITVTLDDGTVLEVGLCSPYGAAAGTFLGGDDCAPNDGSTGTGTITIPDGTQSAEWFFPGDNYGEIGFEIVTPNGNVVGGYTSVEAGPIAIDFCKD